MTRSALTRLAAAILMLLAGVFTGESLAGVSGAQSQAAEKLLAALAVGNAQEVAMAFHPDELEALRTSLLNRLRTEDGQGDSTIRSRLFGPGRSLADIEKLTAVRFYAELAQRLELAVRPFQSVKWLEAVADGKQVHVVGRGKPPRELGDVEVTVLVTLSPYGKGWKAAIPSELQAQLADLIAGRDSRPATSAPPAAVKVPAPPPSPAVLELLDAAEQALIAGRCTEYYTVHMSPNFRRTTSASAQRSLVKACERSDNTRETLVSGLRIVRGIAPQLEAGGKRAIYDVSNQGLPYPRFVLEQVGERWYIAE
ncbi:MAG TPA: hypothetical protein P5528_06665 [Steroidobacteraceae bacterium]|nr:hypothetical protein [Steroidobacteraceae bacterium]HRX89113.1 hypothetical protein [Steroidobacteraceae bacterium]